MSASPSDVASSEPEHTCMGPAPFYPSPCFPCPCLCSCPCRCICLLCLAQQVSPLSLSLCPCYGSCLLPLMLLHPTCNVGIQAETELPGLLNAQAFPFCATYMEKVSSLDPSEHGTLWSAPGGACIKTCILRVALIRVISKQSADSEDPN